MVQILVQAKIKGESERWLSEIGEKKKAVPRIFWNHFNVLGRKLGAVQQHILDEDGNKLEGEAALNYVREITAESFEGNGEVVSAETKSMNENQTEKELVLNDFNWKKVENS